MTSLRDTVEKIRNLEAEKTNLKLEIAELKKMADAKAAVLENEIATLRDEVESLRILMVEEKKQPSSGKRLQEKTEISSKELVEKTLGASNKFGNQIFALSPFSQYFDNWLVNLKQLISEFESNPTIKVDDQFVNDRSQIFLDIECALAQKRLEESNLSEKAKTLADNNQLLMETQKEYSEKTKELNLKKDSAVERITNRIHKLEEEVASQEASTHAKIKVFNYVPKEEYSIKRKKAAEKLSKTKECLKSTRNELEVTQQRFSVEQEILDDNYEKKKREITEQNESLRKELEKLKTDASTDVRQAACNALANAINSLIQRTSQLLEQ